MSRLLNLPAEIRNRIYEYALDARPTILQVTWPLRKAETNAPTKKYIICERADAKLSGRRFNRLQQVCKLFRKDTSDLEVKLNMFMFESTVHVHGTIYGLKKFVNELEDGRVAWMKEVYLMEALDTKTSAFRRHPKAWLRDNIINIFEMLRFCARHERIHVHQFVPYLNAIDSTPAAFMFDCLVILKTFRNVDSTKEAGFRAKEIEKSTRYWKSQILGGKHLGRQDEIETLAGKLNNLTFRTLGRGLKEAWFRKDAMKWGQIHKDSPIRLDKGTLDVWVVLAQGWEKKGL